MRTPIGLAFLIRLLPPVAVLLAPMFAGCGAQTSGKGSGSETNWLENCDSDADCGGLSCLCGVCSKRCSSDDQCSAAQANDCVTANSSGLCSALDDVIGLCVPSCADVDCDATSTCRAGECVPNGTGPTEDNPSLNTESFDVPKLATDAPLGSLPEEANCPCSRSTGAEDVDCPRGLGQFTSQEIGVEGGTLVLTGSGDFTAEVEIPAQALSEPTTVTLIETNAMPPAGLVDFSPVYRFDPPLALKRPAKFKIGAQNQQNYIQDLYLFAANEGTDFEPLEDSYSNAGFMQGSALEVWLLVAGWVKGEQETRCDAELMTPDCTNDDSAALAPNCLIPPGNSFDGSCPGVLCLPTEGGEGPIDFQGTENVPGPSGSSGVCCPVGPDYGCGGMTQTGGYKPNLSDCTAPFEWFDGEPLVPVVDEHGCPKLEFDESECCGCAVDAGVSSEADAG